MDSYRNALNMKKLSFYILSFNIITKNFIIINKNGYRIDSDTAVYPEAWNKNSRWHVTDLDSGTSICSGKTKQEALDNYQKEETKEKMKQAKETEAYNFCKAKYITLKKGL